MKTLYLFLFLSTLLIADTDDRVLKLEETIKKMQQEILDIKADDNELDSVVSSSEQSSVKVNGYINSFYVQYSGEDNADKKDGFRLHRFSLSPHQQINDKLRWLGEVEFEDAPHIHAKDSNNSSGTIFVERIYIQYDINGYLKFRVGRDFAHSTIYSDNHYPSFVLDHMRPALERKIFPQVTDGIEIMGSAYINEHTLDYIFYYGNGNVHDAHEDINTQDLYGTRVRLSLPYFRLSRLSFAYADGYTSDSIIPSDYKKRSYAVGLEEKIDDLEFTGQYARADIKDQTGSFIREGFYLRLSYDFNDFNDFTPWVFYEEYDDSDIDAQDRYKRGSVGIAYSVTKEFKIKYEHCRTVDNKDIRNLLSIALYF